MRPPALPSAAPSYAELFADGCFAQRSMVADTKLREAALQRGLTMPLFPRRECLEPLDRAGALSPVGFLQTNFTPETTWLNPDPALMMWREEREFEPWERYGCQFWGDGITTVSERYSPWQLLYVADALEGHSPRISLRWIENAQADPNDFLVQQRAATAARLRSLDEEWRPLVKLLVALQPRLWSYRRGRTILLHEPGNAQHVDPLPHVVETFDPHALLRRFELSLDELAQLHLELAEAGRKVDPAPRWYPLAEAAPRKVTDDLRGVSLRARDFYDACYMLRGLFYLATDRWLPRADEIDDDRTVYESRRRHLPRATQPTQAQRSDLKELLIREGLYPHRIHFFVEGDTEQIVLERLLPFLGYELPGSGMAVTNIRGVDNAERHAVIFRSATQVAARTVLVADLEGTLSRTLTRLRAEGLFTDERDTLLWSRDGRSIDFEEANFTAREILAAVRAVGRRRNADARLTLTVAELRRERAARTRPKRPPPALTKLALGLAEEPQYGGIRVSKKELAPLLAERLVTDIRRSGDLAEAGKRRPLLARLRYWLVADRV
jgi:hypothetical protein